MTRSPRQTVDAMFEAFLAKDLSAALATVSEDTLWIHNGSQKLPALRFIGKSGAEKFFQTSFTAMQIAYFRPLNFHTSDDIVTVIGEESFTMEGIPGPLTNRWVQIYTVKDGLITRMEEFATSAAAEDYQVVR